MALSNGLVRHYKLDETSGTTITDSGSDAANLTLTGTTAASITGSGQVGTSLTPDGVNDSMTSSGLSLVDVGMTQDLSFSLWYKNVVPAGGDILIEAQLSDNNNGFKIRYESAAYITCAFEIGGTFSGNRIVDNAWTVDGSWHHILVTYEAGGAGVTTYFDGIASDAGGNGGGLGGASVTGLSVGCNTNSSENCNVGLDEICVWNRVLTAEEITLVYDLGYAGKTVTETLALTDSILARYPIDETTGTTAVDSGSEGNNLTLTGTTFDISSVTGQVETAIDFDGANDELRGTCPSVFNAGMTHDWTISFWAKSDIAAPSNDHLLAVFIDNDNLVKIRAVSATPYYIDCSVRNLATNEGIRATHDPTDMEWFNLIITWDASTETVKAYANGVDVSGAASGSTDTGATANELVLGAKSSGLGNWNGPMDEVVIWGRILTSDEISDTFALGNAGQPIDGTVPGAGRFVTCRKRILLGFH